MFFQLIFIQRVVFVKTDIVITSDEDFIFVGLINQPINKVFHLISFTAIADVTAVN
jgi:hypothetical protein